MPFAVLLIALTAAAGPAFDDTFWRHWSDGRAEVASYDLTFPRYGHQRKGTAVTIFVTEPFSHEARVKADPGGHAKADEFPVMKLNLVQDYPTGVYDYNMMTSVFVAIGAHHGAPAGSATKVSFSSQEWCGHVYSQLLFDDGSIRLTSHSYFDGEADQRDTLESRAKGLSEDALFHWARRFAGPTLEPGESKTVPVLMSLERSRLAHRELDWRDATLSRAAERATITVPAGDFEVERYACAIGGGPTWVFEVEAQAPRRIIRWSADDGREAILVGVERMPYWRLNAPGGEAQLEKIGLSPRPRRMP